MKHIARVMRAAIKAFVIATMQYRVQEGMQLMGLLVEALIYLVVWTTVARSGGGRSAATRSARSRPTSSAGCL